MTEGLTIPHHCAEPPLHKGALGCVAPKRATRMGFMLCFGRDKLMQHTNQYQFNLIESGDTFSPQPLNENAEKMEQALAEHADILTGQLKCATGTYKGNGKYGETKPTVLQVEFKPLFAMVFTPNDAFRVIGVVGQKMRRYYTDSNAEIDTIWGDDSVSFYSTGAQGQMNNSNYTYHYFVLGV